MFKPNLSKKNYTKISIVSIIIVFMFIAFGCKQTPESPTAKTPQISSISPDITTTLNDNITLSVGASVSDGGTLSYKWYLAQDKLLNGTEIENASAQDYSLVTNQTGTFYYYCVITNSLGESTRSVVSPRINLTVEASISAKNPVIATQPQNISGEFGDDFEFQVIAYSSDEGTLTYQWYFTNTVQTTANEEAQEPEAAAISGATTSSYTGTIQTEKLGSYYCVITNTITDNNDGGIKTASVQTNKVILSNNIVNANSPVIISQPQDVTAIIPVSRTFTVSAYASDDGELSYQWYKISEDQTEETLIENATNFSLKITEREISKTGYYCAITNTIPDNGDGGCKTSTVNSKTAWFDAIDEIYLKDVILPPEFTAQPKALNIAPYNEHIQISCEAESETGSIIYRWYQSSDGTTANGKLVSHATTSTLTTPLFTEKGIYYYYCVATNILSTIDEGVKSASAISNMVSVAYTGLPTVYVNTPDSVAITSKEEWTKDSTISIKGATNESWNFDEVKTSIRGRGNTTWSKPKKPYALKLDKKQKIMDMPKHKRWVLIANYLDNTFMKNEIAFYLSELLIGK